MAEDAIPGNSAANSRDINAPSGWVSTKQAARSLGVSPRTVRWHIEQGNLVAKPEGEGVRRTWLVSIDSLQAFRHARQSAGTLPQTDRIAGDSADIAAASLGNPIRELADRLAEEAARAAEYRVRLELTEQAQTSLEEELAAERIRREQAERERDELRSLLEASSEARESSVSASGVTGKGTPPEQQEPSQRSSWLYRFFSSSRSESMVR